jgi:hypothetical protein
MNPLWKGTFSVKGEVTELHTHAVSKAQAGVHLRRQLDKKYGRKVYPDDQKIERVKETV